MMMKTISLLFCLFLGSCYSLLAQGRWTKIGNYAYDIPVSSRIASTEGKPLEAKWSGRFQFALGAMNSSPMRFIDPYIYLNAHRRGLTYKMDGKTNYAFSIGIMPELGAQFKLTPFNFQKPTRGRWLINTSVGYNIPLVNYLKEDDRRGLPIDHPKGFFGNTWQATIGVGYELRKSETKRNSAWGGLFRGRFCFGIDYVHEFGNYFNPSLSGLQGSASYLRLRIGVGGL